ncbi:alpha-hydroxy acid oxidase [Streptantibioticus ferralitis]|uniref:Alpha-hydroxy acid oxidase n=1 Tax=Streptantibioticus ferralitis TaxID=236510 RepID=A0ABT5YXG9_9ACTN|nr:alpha-hydroxy acid oxidase [Streptantibioticus ferralitis]MDF2256294.1 alpha-hydroxy acid oxidase [Streptantibioticus ferralitis]
MSDTTVERTPRPSGDGPSGAALVNLADYREAAREILPAEVFDYLEGGAADEHTVRWNQQTYRQLALLPRVLTGHASVDTGCSVFDTALDSPILLAPAASHRLFHPDGEAATARGAAEAGALMTVSTFSSQTVEEIGAAAGGPWWFQLYVQRDRGLTAELVRRARAASARALAVTVDTPVTGLRERDLRNGFALPSHGSPANLPHAPGTSAHGAIHDPRIDPAVDWSDLAALGEVSGLPVLAKGILRAEDAKRAAEAGIGVWISNHGGRNLDTAASTLSALPAIAERVAGRVPVIIDGGVRRGTDVVKALALGADAVAVGRPYIWGLAVDGAGGVRDVIRGLRRETEVAMALVGAATLDDLTPDLVTAAR